MIKKLRKKFILINMLLVSLVLAIVFSILCITSYQRLYHSNRNSLIRTVSQRDEAPLPRPEISMKPDRGSFNMNAVFCVTLNQENEIVSINHNNITLSDEILESAVSKALSSGKEEGVLKNPELQFLKRKTPEGLKIAFADRSSEVSSMKSLLLVSLAAAAGGLLAFFFISLFLSGWALRPVQKSWEQQKQFVADASHELKTPLTVILANIGILISHREESINSQIKWVNNTKEEAVRMKKLVDDLLFLAKSDASKTTMLYSNVNFSDIVWSSLLPFESVAFERGVTIQSHIAPNVFMNGDEGQLKQLIAILLDNACKYAGDKGTVTAALSQSQDRICFKMNNTGMAIPEENIPHIFERFYRTDKSRMREQGGYGLGLAIAKSIVENHHGKITVESTKKAGTTFTVHF